MSSVQLPEGWTQRESTSHPGEFPVASLGKVRVSHILKKSNQSRRPASWRNPNITQSVEEARRQIEDIRQTLVNTLNTEGEEAMINLFAKIASQESDCSSAQKGGDLDYFGKGQMQKPFEDKSFSLAVGELSDITETDSGIHIILRTA